MTTTNNYTTNPKHPDLELSIFLDTDQVRADFDQCFNRINNSDHLFLYTDFGNLPEDAPPAVIIPKEKNTMINLAKALDEFKSFYSYVKNIKECTFDDLIDNHLEAADYTDNDYFTALDKHNIKYTRPYKIIFTQGCNQGDYAKVIIPTEAIKEAWGVKEVNMRALQKTLNHLFWDTPLLEENLPVDPE